MAEGPEHLSNGQFASKDVTGAAAKSSPKTGQRGKHLFKKGQSGNPAGRPRGTPNKLTRDVKEFLAALVSSQRVQEAVEARIEKGDAVAFFRALEHVVGKPRETHDVQGDLTVTCKWEE